MDDAIEPSGGALMPPDDPVTIDALPKEAGLFLILIGIGGILLPGPIGAPFLVLGGLVFFPESYRKFDGVLQRRFPKSHRQGMKQLRRFVDDLEHRYPTHA